jgi:hypothetical protein
MYKWEPSSNGSHSVFQPWNSENRADAQKYSRVQAMNKINDGGSGWIRTSDN